MALIVAEVIIFINGIDFLFGQIKKVSTSIFGLIDIDTICLFFIQIYTHEIFQLFLPWVSSFVVIVLMSILVTGIRLRKEGVVMIALFIQLFMPDPYVERGIRVEQIETKKSKRKESDDKSHLQKSD